MIVSGDFETYYDKDYSLTKLSEVEYILDARFEVIMLSLKINNNASRVYVGHDNIARALSHLNWDDVAWLSHNTRFDGSILAWRYGYVPRLYLDTLSMARAVTHWWIGKSSLKAVSEFLKLPPKGDEVVRAIGKRLADFTPQELDAYATYCERDNDNAYEIFKALRSHVPTSELRLIDLVLRMFILPQVTLDATVITQYLDEVRAEKALALDQVAGIPKDHFSSNQKFAELLTHYGVVVPTKTSPQTGEDIPALARGDWEFKELCADTSQPAIVQTLLATRTSVKSTIDETRAEKLLRLARTTWPTQGNGWATVPLKYSGARTHRLSGDGGLNFQNLRRGSTLKKALRAPKGYRIVHRDASQIEARMVAWMAGCDTLVEAFDQGRDVYSEFATIVYGRLITRADTLERFVGKTGILGLGYGCGPPRFRHMLFIGAGGVSLKVELPEAETIVYTYRSTYPEIVDLWGDFDGLLHDMIQGRVSDPSLLARVPVEPVREGLFLPNDLCIHYPGLNYIYNNNRRDICYDDPYGGTRKLYGAKVVENVSQALARIIVTDIALRTYDSTGDSPWLSTHDSLDYCVPLSEAEEVDRVLTQEFARRPSWAMDLPLASEGGWGETLLDAERGVNQ